MNDISADRPSGAPEGTFSVGAAARILLNGPADSPYRLRMAVSDADIRAAQTLRFLVFNLELSEGLEKSYATLRDEDPFDAVCDHLLVEDTRTGEVVGTYRLQTGQSAAKNLGFYSEQEFDFTPFRPIQDRMVELGRACVHIEHRGLAVLGLLWRGIIDYSETRGASYLIGCSSLTSQSEADGAAAFRELARTSLVASPYRTNPLPAFACRMDQTRSDRIKIPKLLRAYLACGARICGPPAIDREFRTIDFLTLMDLAHLPDSARS